jgi:hypothetical protein
MAVSRRNFLTAAGLAPLACLAGGSALAAEAAACYNPAALPLRQKSQRRSLGYVEKSGDAKNRCAACAFFTAGSQGCGTCQLLGGGAVNAGAVCDSFAAKAA